MQTSHKQKQQEKAEIEEMSDDRKLEVVAQLTDDVLSKLTAAFFDVCKLEHWTKRDLSQISGMNETAIGHILAGRRKNVTVETIALLARAMKVRPELVLHDMRPNGNHMPPQREAALLLGAKEAIQRSTKAFASAFASTHDTTQRTLLGNLNQEKSASAESIAYAQPDLEKELSQ